MLILKRILRILRKLIIIFFVVSIVWVIFARFFPIYATPLMFIRSTEAVFSGEMPKNSKTWVPIEDISQKMVQAVVASEDNKFMHHWGFSFGDMSKAFQHNLKGKRIRGGSTISQQTAKNVFLWPGRSYVRKAFEAYFTVLIELIWSKERIMEVYLNVIEMGEGIYGIEAASLEHFGVHASELSSAQAALIAACLPNPRRFNPAHPSPYIQRRKSQIISLMPKIEQINFHEKTNFSSKKKHKKR